MGKVEVEVLVGFAVQLVYKVLNDACALVRVKISDEHVDVEVLALKQAQQTSVVAMGRLEIDLA